MVLVATTAYAQSSLVGRNANLYRHGIVSYKLEESTRPAYEGRLTFADNGDFVETLSHPHGYGADVVRVDIVKQGATHFVVVESPTGRMATFSGSRAQIRLAEPQDCLIEKPNWALGLPLTQSWVEKADIRVSRDDKGRPVRLSKFSHGAEVFHWDYEWGVASGTSLDLPKLATKQIGGVSDRRYAIRFANLKDNPSKNDLSVKWYTPGTAVVDERVEPAIVLTYDQLKKLAGGAATLSPEDLLVLTSRRHAEDARDDAAKRRRLQKQSGQTPQTGVIIVLIAIPMVGYAVRWMIIRTRKRA